MKKDIEKALKILEGKSLINIGRASNMLWLGFGKEFKGLDINGNDIMFGEFSLNIQCCWRFYRNNKIKLASNDFYHPHSKLKDDDDFDWDEIGVNRFDELADQFNEKIDVKYSIQSISADNLGGLKVAFKNGIVFEAFPDESLPESEHWRFINRNTKDHLVVTGKGIED